MTRKLGIFAGTFDPVHLGHRAFVEQSISQYSLDQVLILIEKKPRYKNCLAAYRHRKKMVELAFANNAKVVLYESASQEFPITGSIKNIRADYPKAELYLLIGEDVAGHIDGWENRRKLLKDVKLIIGKRDEQSPYGQASSLKVRAQLKSQTESDGLDLQVQNYIKEQDLY